mmetsp:Transcript_12419/g.24144  ORF Transcript_12419/g.24144 Transcript_12419/m.24144 type:complete len:176 (-) Transcript_12419:59-586(-)
MFGLCQTDEENSGFSFKRLCTGICGVVPSLIWCSALVYFSYAQHGNVCASTLGDTSHGGHITNFIRISAVAFGLLVVLEIIEACTTGEADLKVTGTEILINVCTVVIFLFIYGWNYWGFMQVITGRDCTEGLITYGWLTLLGNNIVWFMTVGSMIAAQICNTSVAAADYLAGDRL